LLGISVSAVKGRLLPSNLKLGNGLFPESEPSIEHDGAFCKIVRNGCITKMEYSLSTHQD
jgi:hypothetical protein